MLYDQKIGTDEQTDKYQLRKRPAGDAGVTTIFQQQVQQSGKSKQQAQHQGEQYAHLLQRENVLHVAGQKRLIVPDWLEL